MEYNWPGNIRELQNVVESAVALCRDNIITNNHIPLEIRREDFVSSRDCEKCNENVSLEDLKKAFNITYDWFSYLVQTN
jgi:DNA-binding NtrC family response regulator